MATALILVKWFLTLFMFLCTIPVIYIFTIPIQYLFFRLQKFRLNRLLVNKKLIYKITNIETEVFKLKIKSFIPGLWVYLYDIKADKVFPRLSKIDFYYHDDGRSLSQQDLCKETANSYFEGLLISLQNKVKHKNIEVNFSAEKLVKDIIE